MSVLMTAGPSGFAIANEDRKMISSIAASRGDVLQIDLSVVDSDSMNWTTMEGVAASNDVNLYGIALEDIASGASGVFRFRGMVDAGLTTTSAVGTFLEGFTTELLIVASAASKIIAVCLETGIAGTPTRVIFDGLSGFGNDNA